MEINLVMAEFGRDRVNIGGAQFGNDHRLNPTYSTFKKYFPDAKITLYTDYPDILRPDEKTDDIEVRVVKPIFGLEQSRYGNRCNDYYKVLGLLNSDSDIAIALDSDMAIVSPEVYSLIPDSEKEDIDSAVAAAKEAFKTWSKTPKQERSDILMKLADTIEKYSDELIKAESKDNGKPETLAAHVDIPRASANIRFLIRFESFQDGFFNLQYNKILL